MKLVQIALSTCLVVGSMAAITAPALADGGYSRHGGHHGGGHHGSGHVSSYRGGHGGGHGGGYSSGRRGHGAGGAFVAGTVVGALLGWNGGYGYSHAQRGHFQRYHQPYYTPRRQHHSPHYYGGHARRYYSYSDGDYDDSHTYRDYGNAGCHPVHRFGQWHGRPAKIGGTMCYNRYGGSYVVSGSRYLIHYR